MNIVGADKRTQYYRMKPEEVLVSLKSHTMGLTNTEAVRRHTNAGANALPQPDNTSHTQTLLLAAGHPFVALSAIASLLASSLDQPGLAAVMLGLTVTHIAIRFYGLQLKPLFDGGSLLPVHVKVTRNDQTRSLDIAKLVVGDIVHLETGEMVPADIRLLTEQDFTTNDAVLLGGNVHTRKFAHVINHDVPLIARNNIAWAGTTVVRGSALGVVIAIGAQTELGRISILQQVASTRGNLGDRVPRRYIFTLFALVGLSVTAFLGWQTGTSQSAAVLALLAFAIGTTPHGLHIVRLMMGMSTKRTLAKQGIQVANANALIRLGNTDTLFIDTTEAAKSTATATAITVGRTRYSVEDSGYEPGGRICSSDGTPLSKKDLRELKLLFEAGALVNTANVLRPDSHHKSWRAHGNLYEAAVLVLARKAGLHTEQLRSKYEELRFFPYDAGRGMASSVRRYGDDLVVFVRGNPEKILESSKKIWDHGHVRTLSTNDRAFLASEAAQPPDLSHMAFAFRILPKRADVTTLTIDEAEQELTFLGLVGTTSTNSMDAFATTAQQAGLRTVLLTNEISRNAHTSGTIRKLDDAQLLQLLQSDSPIFTRLNPEDLLRLVAVRQQAGHTVAMLGTNIANIPALCKADVGLTFNNQSAQTLRAATDIHIRNQEDFTATVNVSRLLGVRFKHLYTLAVIETIAMALIVLVGAFNLFYGHVPLPVSAPVLLAVQLAFLPLAGLATATNKRIVCWRFSELFVAGAALAILVYASFLMYFSLHNISPSYISPASEFVQGATAVSLAIFALSLWIENFIASWHTQANQSLRFNVCFSLGVLSLLGILYIPGLQTIFGTTGLQRLDWLLVAAAGILYVAFRLFQRHARHHSRHAVIKLHHETFGKDAPLHL